MRKRSGYKIKLGSEHEDGSEVVFRVSEELGRDIADALLYVKRPGAIQWYHPETIRKADCIIWPITRGDTALCGYGVAQVVSKATGKIGPEHQTEILPEGEER